MTDPEQSPASPTDPDPDPPEEGEEAASPELPKVEPVEPVHIDPPSPEPPKPPAITARKAPKPTPILAVTGLSVSLPGGATVVSDASLTLRPGRVVALLGPSGAGKSTLLRAITAPEELRERGYGVSFDDRVLDAEVAFIPQRGALFDHLDVAGNIGLAQIAGGKRVHVEPWLSAVDLDHALAEKGTSVATLSGGQAQRLAVARTLAAGRSILVLDEPSVGLDPLGVRRLAKLLIDQARSRGVAMLVITHDLALAAGACDEVIFLDPSKGSLTTISKAEPAELVPEDERADRISRLEAEVVKLASRALAPQRSSAQKPRRALAKASGPGPLSILGSAIVHALNPRLARPSFHVMMRGVGQSLVKPLVFYATVGALLGFTVLYIIAKMSADLRAGAVLKLVGGTYILSLAPPLSAILFAATSGNAVNAWLGGMQLGKQVLALAGLGVPAPRYLWSPAWIALAISYMGTLLVFIASMIAGGAALFELYDVKDAIPILTSDFLDPAPGRGPYLVRGIWLAIAYAAAIATIVVGRGAAPKDEAAEVTSAMTSAVVRVTLFVVAMELASVVVLFVVTGK